MILFKRKKRHYASVEITPLIDIVFLLLIFFMLSSTFIKPAIKMRLPVVASGLSGQQSKLVLAVDKDQKIFLGDKLVALAELTGRIKALAPKGITFKADRGTTYEIIVQIMGKLKKAGIKNISMQYERKK